MKKNTSQTRSVASILRICGLFEDHQLTSRSVSCDQSHLVYASDLTLYRIIFSAGPAGSLMTRHVDTDQVHVFGQKLQKENNKTHTWTSTLFCIVHNYMYIFTFILKINYVSFVLNVQHCMCAKHYKRIHEKWQSITCLELKMFAYLSSLTMQRKYYFHIFWFFINLWFFYLIRSRNR